jgi:glycosyltransferase involved in cell wall biosynthesis
MRFVFYVPVTDVARGGISVIMDMIDVLNREGFEAVALYDRPDFEYAAHVVRAPRLWSPMVRRPKNTTALIRRVRSAARQAFRGRSPSANAAPCPLWQPRRDDAVIVPEFVAHWLPSCLPDGTRQYLLVQNPFALARAFAAPGFDAAPFSGSIAVSEVCAAAGRMMLGVEPERVPLFLSDTLYAFTPDKKRQIAYMPRKRGVDAVPLVKALRAAPELEGVPFVAIDGVSTEKAAAILRDSLFFLSLSEREGFGLPPAEAMATGAIVIGYTGVGGDEFFTAETGFPVPEDNLPAFYDTVISAVTQYDSDPGVGDRLRAQASQTILSRYPRAAFERAVTEVFGAWRGSAPD